MSLSEISKRISDTITDELNYSEEKKEIVAYGMESVLLGVIGTTAILIVAFLFNALVPTVFAALFGGFLRKLSGGAHFSTPFKCLAFGAIIYSLLGVFSKLIIYYNIYNVTVLVITLSLSSIIIAILAPVDCESKPIHSINFRRKLKLASIFFMAVTFGVVLFSNNSLLNTSAVLGVVYQTITLLPVFNNKKKEVY